MLIENYLFVAVLLGTIFLLLLNYWVVAKVRARYSELENNYSELEERYNREIKKLKSLSQDKLLEQELQESSRAKKAKDVSDVIDTAELKKQHADPAVVPTAPVGPDETPEVKTAESDPAEVETEIKSPASVNDAPAPPPALEIKTGHSPTKLEDSPEITVVSSKSRDFRTPPLAEGGGKKVTKDYQAPAIDELLEFQVKLETLEKFKVFKVYSTEKKQVELENFNKIIGALSDKKVRLIGVDFTDVLFLYSHEIGKLTESFEFVEKQQGTLAFFNVSEELRLLFSSINLEKHLNLFSSRAEFEKFAKGA